MTSTGRAKAKELNAIAQRQHGAVSRAQALGCGYSDSAIGRLIETGLWTRAFRGVYLVRPTANTFQREVMALVLRAPGRTWASHRAAAWLWGLPRGGRPTPEVSTVANLRSRKYAVHRVLVLPRIDRRVSQGIPVTSIERTLIDLAALVNRREAARLLGESLRGGLTNLNRIERRLARGDLGRRAGRVEQLLESWRGLEASESPLEDRLQRLIEAHGLPEPTPQWRVEHGGRVVARIDIAYPDRMLAIEADGYRWHHDRERWRRDLARRNLLTGLGWRVLHFTWDDVHRHPDRVVAHIRTSLEENWSKSPAGREKTTRAT